MPKKRKRGAGLGNRKKYNIKDRSYVTQIVDRVQIRMRNDYRSFCIDGNPPIKRNKNMHLIEAQNHVLSCQRKCRNPIPLNAILKLYPWLKKKARDVTSFIFNFFRNFFSFV